jgi:hypothetical protein
LIEKTSNHGGEALRVRPAIEHEPGKRLGRIDRNQPSLPDRTGYVKTALLQLLKKLITMGPGCDHHGRIPGPERGADKAADSAQQGRVPGIKLDHMTMEIMVVPLRLRRQRSSHRSVTDTHPLNSLD